MRLATNLEFYYRTRQSTEYFLEIFPERLLFEHTSRLKFLERCSRKRVDKFKNIHSYSDIVSKRRSLFCARVGYSKNLWFLQIIFVAQLSVATVLQTLCVFLLCFAAYQNTDLCNLSSGTDASIYQAFTFVR